MTTQDQQDKQKYTLNHEIRLLEKQRGDLLSEIERMDASKREEYRQFTEEIKELKRRRDQLLEDVEKTRDTLVTLTTAYEQSKESVDQYVKKRLEDAKKEGEALTASAKQIETDAIERHSAATTFQKELEEQKTALDVKEGIVENQKRLNAQEFSTLEALRASQVEQTKHFTEQIAEFKEKVGKLTREVEDLSKTKDNLIESIIETRRAIATELQEVKDKGVKVDELLVSLTQREEVLATKEKELTDAQVLLKDRQETLERAVEEYRTKGVNI